VNAYSQVEALISRLCDPMLTAMDTVENYLHSAEDLLGTAACVQDEMLSTVQVNYLRRAVHSMAQSLLAAGDYDTPEEVFEDVLEQVTSGKGHERHGNGGSFEAQPIVVICRQLGHSWMGFPVGQALKKLHECRRLEDEQRIQEVLGAIAYASFALLEIHRRHGLNMTDLDA